jgi:uncharacterized protein (TIGR01319 family)
VIKTLKDKSALVVVENIRPVLERENLTPARNRIHDLFMEHVMAHAPGYKKLMEWTDVPIMPTPGAVGLLIEKLGKSEAIDVLGVDIGGATTDIFSVFLDPMAGERVFNRTVSANLGMSYSISNVLAEAGMENIMRWIPFEIPENSVRNRIRNKMIRPTTIPQTLEELKIEQAIAREALRLALSQHRSMAVGLKGVQQERTISEAFAQTTTGATLVNLMNLNLVVGSGGALSHAPRRIQAALMLLDGFLPEGVTRLAVDSIFMMPHLGVLSTVHEAAAKEVFDKDCLIRLGTAIAPVGEGKEGMRCVTVKIKRPDGQEAELVGRYGEIYRVELKEHETAQVEIIPERGFDVGVGRGKRLDLEVAFGVVGLIIDCRGRPFNLPKEDRHRIEALNRWAQALDLHPA